MSAGDALEVAPILVPWLALPLAVRRSRVCKRGAVASLFVAPFVGTAILLPHIPEGRWRWIILFYLNALIVAGGWSALLAALGTRALDALARRQATTLPFSLPVSSAEPQSVSRSSAASGLPARDRGFSRVVLPAQRQLCSVPVSWSVHDRTPFAQPRYLPHLGYRRAADHLRFTSRPGLLSSHRWRRVRSASWRRSAGSRRETAS